MMGRVGLSLNLVGVALLVWYLRACRRFVDKPTPSPTDWLEAPEATSPLP